MSKTGRERAKIGRRVRYNPTTTEVGIYGDGPYIGRITKVAADGTTTLVIAGANGTEFVVATAKVGGNDQPGTYDYFGGVQP